MQNSVDEKITGLSSEQVAERQAKGQVNTPAVSPTKTIAQIRFFGSTKNLVIA